MKIIRQSTGGGGSGGGIYVGNGVVPAKTEATVTDTITFKGGQVALSVNTQTPGATDDIVIDWNTGNLQVIDLADSDATPKNLTLTNAVAATGYTIKIIQGANDTKINFPALKWGGVSPLVVSGVDGNHDLISITFDGTEYSASYEANFG